MNQSRAVTFAEVNLVPEWTSAANWASVINTAIDLIQNYWLAQLGISRYLKLVTVSSFCRFTLISLLMPLVLFVINLVFKTYNSVTNCKWLISGTEQYSNILDEKVLDSECRLGKQDFRRKGAVKICFQFCCSLRWRWWWCSCRCCCCCSFVAAAVVLLDNDHVFVAVVN